MFYFYASAQNGGSISANFSIFPEPKLHPKSWLNFSKPRVDFYRFWNINFESILNKIIVIVVGFYIRCCFLYLFFFFLSWPLLAIEVDIG